MNLHISFHFRMLPIFLKVVQKLHKEHLSTTPAPDVQTISLISDLLQLGLDMCKTRMSMMPQESRKAFINIMTNLIEKSSDAKLLRVITKIVEEWVKSKVHTSIYMYMYSRTSLLQIRSGQLSVSWLKEVSSFEASFAYVHFSSYIIRSSSLN